ncbi:MAG: phosphate ABC transporter substrate-binding/OmpA family protein [Pseudomonadota bacterium]
MIMLRAAAFAALLLLGAAAGAAAQSVTLTSPGGGVTVSGDLLGFDGEFYRVDTIYGPMTVDAAGVGCEGNGCPDLSSFVSELFISGSARMGTVLVPALIEGFAARAGLRAERRLQEDGGTTYLLTDPAERRVTARFHLRATNTDEGFADLLATEADIVMAARVVRPEERQRAREVGLGDLSSARQSRVVALDALIPVVSTSSMVSQIAPEDMAGVLSGRVINWQDLRGPDAPVVVHLPSPALGLGQAVEDLVLRPVDQRLTVPVEFHLDLDDLATAVQADPFALGLTSYSDAGGTRALTLTGGCDFRQQATRRTVKTEDYPLTMPLLFYMPAKRLPKIGRDFLNFLRTPSAQLVVRRSGFIDQTPEEIALQSQGDRFTNAILSAGPEITLEELQRMTRRLWGMSRLTTSFRFEPGSVRLDAQSRSNVQQLAEVFETGRYDARTVVFIGFSDGEGAARPNRDIALQRAETVRKAVQRAARDANFERVTVRVDAFGEALPMACDDTPWGRDANRRVEVWVR